MALYTQTYTYKKYTHKLWLLHINVSWSSIDIQQTTADSTAWTWAIAIHNETKYDFDFCSSAAITSFYIPLFTRRVAGSRACVRACSYSNFSKTIWITRAGESLDRCTLYFHFVFISSSYLHHHHHHHHYRWHLTFRIIFTRCAFVFHASYHDSQSLHRLLLICEPLRWHRVLLSIVLLL